MVDKTRYAVVESNSLVRDVILIGDQTTAIVPDFDEAAGPGYTWNGTAFVAPEPPPSPDPAPTPSSPIEKL